MTKGARVDAIAVYEPETAIQAYNVEPVIEAYLRSLDVKPRSKETYAKGVRYFFAYLDREGITEPTRADILAYKESLTERYSTCTAASYLTAVRSFISYLNAERGFPNIAAGVKNPRNRRSGFLKDALTAEQANKVLSTMKRETLAQKRDYAVIVLLTLTGLRTIEVERANLEDIRNLNGARVLYVWGKGRDSKDEYVKLTATVQEAIADYLEAREAADGRLTGSSPLFASVSRRDYGKRITARSVSRIAKEALKAAGFDDSRLTAHSFRHTAITLARRGGASIRDAQQMARHGNVTTTERYAHDERRIEDAAEDAAEAALLSFRA